MKIEHIAIWTRDIEKMKDFYLKFFDLTSNKRYHNPIKQFSSYFLSFEKGAIIAKFPLDYVQEEIVKLNIGEYDRIIKDHHNR